MPPSWACSVAVSPPSRPGRCSCDAARSRPEAPVSHPTIGPDHLDPGRWSCVRQGLFGPPPGRGPRGPWTTVLTEDDWPCYVGFRRFFPCMLVLTTRSRTGPTTRENTMRTTTGTARLTTRFSVGLAASAVMVLAGMASPAYAVPGNGQGNGQGNGAQQGASPSDPDGGSNGGADKPGGTGGTVGDQDGNNGSGNDADC